MGYDILSKIIEFTDSEDAIEKRLKNVAGLLMESFSFDQCAVYRFDHERNKFHLSVVAGDKRGCCREYDGNEGLPGLVMKHGKPIFAVHSRPGKELWRGVFDKGMLGFTAVVCAPVKDDIFYGILYLKSRERKKMPPKKKKLLNVITLQLATAIKNYQCIVHLTEANERMRDMQARLVHAEKLLALGEMAATLAHEIRNPLMSIGGFAKRLKSQIGPDFSHSLYVDRIVKEVGRLEKLMDGIVHFSEKDGYEFLLQDINVLLKEAVQFFEDDFKRNRIAVVKEFCEDMATVEVDPQQLKLVFNNLLANAIQAMEGGGTLTLKTRQEENWVIAEIGDTGGGIAPEIMGNIFNPFYTTKEAGTGLGLAITHTIITNHKGAIDVNNRINKGVTFTIKLPAAEADRGRIALKKVL